MKTVNGQIGNVIAFTEGMKQLILSTCEDVADSESMTEAWDKINRCYQDLDALRKSQKCIKTESNENIQSHTISSENYEMLLNDGALGFTRHLQDVDLPIMVNSVINGDDLEPSEVSEMHIGYYDAKPVLFITPLIVG